MSIADKVGQSSSFGRSRRSDRGRAKAITEGAIPSYELVRLDLAKVSPTPLNPRRNFGTKEEMTRFGEELRQVQLAACVAVSRAAYLKLWPSHEDLIGDSCEHILINGERRYRSALHVGVEQLDFVVRDDLASSREEFVDHLLAENLEREDFDVIERARGVQQLVDVCAEGEGERGARSRAAERLGKDRSWVTNQLALLTLPAPLQEQLSSGAVSERDGRFLARHLSKNPGLDTAALLEHLASVKEAASQQRETQQRLIDAGRQVLQQSSADSLLSADNKPSPAAPSPADEEPHGTSDDALLSADNNIPLPPVLPAASVESQTAAGGSLSADNNFSLTVLPPAGADEDGRSNDASLSADNEAAALSAPEEASRRRADGVQPEPSVPSQATGQNIAEPRDVTAVKDKNAALTALERHTRDAAEFAVRLQSIAALHREAAEADREVADKLLAALREQIQKALARFPADVTGR
ncbi:ParB/RepB/Spo0J family partition protein [Streptomyces sp. NPDC013012]|uniref:ParB/RepB/Spo0J family partition protein n=1 Tax=Streptomyces sp. NPDC013012 TaxID=3364860 RepID=UPI0036C1BF0E